MQFKRFLSKFGAIAIAVSMVCGGTSIPSAILAVHAEETTSQSTDDSSIRYYDDAGGTYDGWIIYKDSSTSSFVYLMDPTDSTHIVDNYFGMNVDTATDAIELKGTNIEYDPFNQTILVNGNIVATVQDIKDLISAYYAEHFDNTYSATLTVSDGIYILTFYNVDTQETILTVSYTREDGDIEVDYDSSSEEVTELKTYIKTYIAKLKALADSTSDDSSDEDISGNDQGSTSDSGSDEDISGNDQGNTSDDTSDEDISGDDQGSTSDDTSDEDFSGDDQGSTSDDTSDEDISGNDQGNTSDDSSDEDISGDDQGSTSDDSNDEDISGDDQDSTSDADSGSSSSSSSGSSSSSSSGSSSSSSSSSSHSSGSNYTSSIISKDGTSIVSSINGIYETYGSISNVAVVTNKSTFAADINAASGSNVSIDVIDSECGAAAKECVTEAISFLSDNGIDARVDDMIDVYAYVDGEKAEDASNAFELELDTSKQEVKAGYELGVVLIEDGGKIRYLEDEDTDSDTVTLSTTGFGVYALIEVPEGSLDDIVAAQNEIQ